MLDLYTCANESEIINYGMVHNKYLDSTDDLLRDCREKPNSNNCIVSSLVGGLYAYLMLPVYFVGLVGNISNIVIFSCKIRYHSRVLIYFLSLALADLAYLSFWGVGWFFLAKGLPFATNGQVGWLLMNSSPTECRAARFLNSFIGSCTVNLLLLATIDRCLVLYLPEKFGRPPTIRNTAIRRDQGIGLNCASERWHRLQKLYGIVFVSLVLFITFLLALPNAIFVNHVKTKYGIWCGLDKNFYTDGIARWFQINRLLLSGSFSGLAFLATFVASVLLMQKLRVFVKNRNKLLTPAAALAANIVPGRKNVNNCRSKTKANSVIKSVTILVFLSTVTLLATLPKIFGSMTAFYIIVYCDRRGGVPLSTLRLVYNVKDIGEFCFFVSLSVNAFVYFRQMPEYKSEVIRLATKFFKRT